MIDDALRAEAAFIPDPGAAALLADPGLVPAPELRLDLGVALGDLAQRGRKAPLLNRSCAASSALG
jgi:hypothetical protein